MKFILALLALSAVASARTIKIEFSGTMVDWQGKSVYDAQMEGDLEVPTPWGIEVYIDEDAMDSDPSETRGIYTSPASHIVFRFGPFEEDHQGATVEVWSGHPVGGQPLWGFFFRNKFQGSAYNVYRPAGTGIYAFYTNADYNIAPLLIPTDSLEHLLTAQGNFAFDPNKHFYHNGVAGYPQVRIHAEADNDISGFTAELID